MSHYILPGTNERALDGKIHLTYHGAKFRVHDANTAMCYLKMTNNVFTASATALDASLTRTDILTRRNSRPAKRELCHHISLFSTSFS